MNELCAQLEALLSDVPYLDGNLANASALLYQSMDRLNWAGFYLLRAGALRLSAFQGKPACVKIELGRGVCGTAALEDSTLVVRDVHAFPGHIACDADSRSEIVVPLHCGSRVVGVLDLDSPIISRFGNGEKETLEAFARTLERLLKKQLSEIQ